MQGDRQPGQTVRSNPNFYTYAGQCDHRLRDLGQFLVVLGQTPPSSQPTECSLDHPPARHDHEAGGTHDAADDDQAQAEQETRDQDRQPVVDAVSEDRLKPTVQALDPLQQLPGAVGVLDARGVNEDAEQETGTVNGNVALAPFDLLGRVVTARPPFSVVLGTPRYAQTLWVSMMAAVGLGSRPSCSRSIVTRWWRMVSQTPAPRKARK